MKIKNTEGLTIAEIQNEINKGGKFVIYQYCVSIVIMTFKRPTDIYFIRADENPLTKGLPYSLISFVVGWWGIPWGPIYTIGSLIKNFGGGKDVTNEIFNALIQHQPLDEKKLSQEVTN
jgi:hypothetical protein